MSAGKINALQDLVDIPKDTFKLKLYERKLHDASLTLLFNCRKILLNSEKSSKSFFDIFRMVSQLKMRIDRLIDRSRLLEVRIRPGTPDKTVKIILNNAILYDLISFSRSWDLNADIIYLDGQIIFQETEKINDIARKALNNIQVIDEIFSNKSSITTNIQSSEELAHNLLQTFNQELELAEQAGALKGIIKLEKPKLIGKSKYYEVLGNIVLKIIMSFELANPADPIAVRAIYSRLTQEYPRVNAEMKDLLKVIDDLSMNGLIITKQDKDGLQWIQLQPSEPETNIILQLAKEKGYVSIEELILITNWSIDEGIQEMEKFVQAGLAVKDTDYSTGTKYYFPGLSE
ncbi:MAG: hypothetical protein ACFFDW_13165 [Candidatus Thorarchaeota archaeon]